MVRTVGDLIKELQEFDADLLIGFAISAGSSLGVLSLYDDGDDMDKPPKKVWIDLG